VCAAALLAPRENWDRLAAKSAGGRGTGGSEDGSNAAPEAAERSWLHARRICAASLVTRLIRRMRNNRLIDNGDQKYSKVKWEKRGNSFFRSIKA
jgi:hypothetical protein